MKIGNAKYGGGKKNFKIKDGDNIYGILPPLGELADKGRWSQYYRVEWGFKDLAGKLKPFQDCRVVNRKTKMVDVESAAHVQREQLKAQKESLVELFKAGQATQEQVKDATNLVKQFNLDCKHYLNVINPQGEIGLLKIGHRAKIALDAAIQSLRDQGIEPIGMTGVYFNLNRFIPKNAAGRDMPLDTTYTITPYAENVQAEVNGQMMMVQQRKTYALTDAVVNRLADEAYELNKLYPVVTAEDVDRFVKEGAVAVDAVLSKKASEEAKPEEAAAPAETAVAQAATQLATPVAEAPVTTPVTQAAAPVAAAPVVETPAAAAPVTAAPVVETPAPVVETKVETAAAPATMSDDDFLKSIGAV